MKFLPFTLITLLLGVGITVGLFGLELVQVPETYTQTLSWLGRFHMVILHMPIGLLAAWVLLQLMQWFLPHYDVDPAISTMLFFTWISALLAVFTGTFLDWYGKYSPTLLDHHRDSAVLFTAFLTMALTFRVLRKLEESFLWVVGYVLCLIGASVWIIPTGHRGGTLTHGAGFLTDRAPEYLSIYLPEPSLKTLSIDETLRVGDEPHSVYFTETILPIFEEYCTRCHGAEKQKGEFRLDTYTALLKGGQNGSVFNPADPTQGSMYRGLVLELEDDLHMPPDGKPQLELEELEVLKAWIVSAAGASAH